MDPFEFVDRRPERAAAAQLAFLDHPTFLVAVLARPAIGQGSFAGCKWISDLYTSESSTDLSYREGVMEVCLEYIEEGAESGRRVLVSTSITGNGYWPPRLQAELRLGRDMLYDQGLSGADPGDAELLDEGEVFIDGLSLEAEMLTQGELWIARAECTLPSDDAGTQHVVTILGHGVNLQDILLSWVDDLGPYLREKRRREAAAQMRALEALRVAKKSFSSSLDAHQALLELTLQLQEEIAEMKAQSRASVGSSAAEEARRGALWEAAVESQMRCARQGYPEANDAVWGMVEHMRELASVAPWFRDAKLAGRAIVETVAYTRSGDSVDSASAQEAWQRYSRSRAGEGIDSGEEDSDVELPAADLSMHQARNSSHATRSIREQWLHEWRLWRDRLL